MRSRTTSGDAASRSCTEASPWPPSKKCTWASLKPGTTLRPRSSSTSVGSGPASDFDVCADRRDLAVEDGDRLGLGLPWIAGPDLAVDEDRVGVCLGAGHGR